MFRFVRLLFCTFARRCLLVLACVAVPVWAGGGFYWVEVPIEQQTPQARALATEMALKDVLWRVTGQKLGEKSIGLSGAFKNAESYVEAYSYRRLPASGVLPESQVLQVQFSPAAIQQLLNRYQLPLWPENRPRVLVWLFQKENGRITPASNSRQADSESLTTAAQLRGLTLEWAKASPEELAGFTAAGLLKTDGEEVLNASFRYGLDHILVGVLDGDNGQWVLLQGQDKKPLPAATPSQALHAFADAMAKRYSQSASQQNQPPLTLFVTLADFVSHQQCMAYFQQQPLVKQVRLVALSGKTLELEIHLQGSEGAFRQQLTLEKRLTPEPAQETSTPNAKQAYRWQ